MTPWVDLSPATVSLRLKHLEEEVGVPLFERKPNKLVLSPKGEILLAQAQRILQHVDDSLALIRDCGCRTGLVFNPATPLTYLEHVLDKVDMGLLMSVNPGFGGQSFIPATLDKLRAARRIIDASGHAIRLEIECSSPLLL